MEYTTTKCPHCGYRTRNRESGVPKIELGQTLACCPMCDKPIIDPIYTEYEFMTEKEQQKWSTSSLTTAEILRGIITLVLGFIIFVAGISSGEGSGVVAALLIGGALIAMGIGRFFTAKKASELNVGEQAIYESLLRTSNKTYVNLLKKAYGKKRTYRPLENREDAMEYYKEYSSQEIHERFEKNFMKLLNILDNQSENLELKNAKLSSSFVDGGALVAGVMAAPSAIAEVKQSRALAKKKAEEEKASKSETNDNNSQSSTNTDMSSKKSNNKAKTGNKNNQQGKNKDNSKPEISNKDKLLELKGLYDEGLITEEEYNEKRKHILDSL